MNKIWGMVVVCVALGVTGGCAKDFVRPVDAEAERKANAQRIAHNAIVNDNDCVTADSAAVASVYARMGITPGTVMTPAQKAQFGFLYGIERKPECIRGKTGAATDGGRYGVTPEELARMEKVQECTRASLLLKALEAKEVSVVVGDGSVREHLEAVSRDCGNWHEQRRADALVAAENALRERCTRPRFFGPHPWSNPEFYRECERLGFAPGPTVIQFGVTTQPLYIPGPSPRERLMERAGYDRSGQIPTGNGGQYRRR